jgi:hypothetical protein
MKTTNANSWYGYVKAAKGSLLIGGARRHKSVRFATAKQASAWIEQSLKVNSKAGRPVGSWGVVSSPLQPEIGEDGKLCE